MSTERLYRSFGFLMLATAFAPAVTAAQQVPESQAVQAAYGAGTRSKTGAPGAAYWQIWPKYELNAWLEPDSAVVRGNGSITFENSSPVALDRVVLRLDQNRFRRSQGSTPVTRGMVVRSIAINGQAVDLSGPAVSDLSETVLVVQLPTSLEPARILTVSLEWDYEVPEDNKRLALRQGRWGNELFQLGQWYPRLAMLDDLGGWDSAPHDGNSEFFNPFGTFRVALHVPSGWRVGASGTLQNPEEVLGPVAVQRLREVSETDTTVLIVDRGEEGAAYLRSAGPTTRWVFRADSVNDFAWGASSQYSWTTMSRTVPGTGRVLLHAFASDRHREVLSESLPQFITALYRLSSALMPYAWPSHTLLDGPEGGMEYPGVTMSNGGIVNHEIAHQWFPMMVGSDESRFDFMDEGFANFYAAVAAGAPLGAKEAERRGFVPLIRAADVRVEPSPTLGYGRGSRMLHALVSIYGEASVLQALQSYALQWRFKHPSPWDFMASMEASLGVDLDSFWNTWLFNTVEIPPSNLEQ